MKKAHGQYSLDTEAYVADKEGNEHEIEITIWFDAYYQAAKISGPPEDCYPEEGELEIVKVEVDGSALPVGVSEADVIAGVMDDGDMMDRCWDEYFDMREDGND